MVGLAKSFGEKFHGWRRGAHDERLEQMLNREKKINFFFSEF
jgi:hypothetical protein